MRAASSDKLLDDLRNDPDSDSRVLVDSGNDVSGNDKMKKSGN